MEARDITFRTKDPRRFGWFGAVLGLAALAGSGAGIGDALADSGDFAAVVNGATDYLLPTTSCDTLREEVDVDAELILACSIGSRGGSPGTLDSPCDIVNNVTNAGLAVGQCLTDDYPTPFLPVDPDADVLEADTNIRATAAGSNLALGDRDQISVTSVGTGGGTVLGLVDVRRCASSGTCGPGPASCDGIPVIASQPACTEVQDRLADSVLANPPDLSHALFFDLEQTGTDGVLKVAVCDNYTWSCRTPGTQVANTSYQGQVPFSIVDTPICIRMTRSTRCP
jgi:hypothetical protein